MYKMCLETFFENGKERERVGVMDVWWEGAPEAEERASEGFRPHGGQTGGWYIDVNGRKRPKRIGCVEMQTIRGE